MSILVLALRNDLHADAVIDHLQIMGAHTFRIDPTDDSSLPVNISISGPPFQARFDFADGQRLEFDTLSGVFCRFAVDSMVANDSAPLAQFSESERIAAFNAALRLVDRRKWINDPWAEARADCKILQSSVAISLGIDVPACLITQRVGEVVEFAQTQNDCVIKPISDVPLACVNGTYLPHNELYTNNFSAPYTAAIPLSFLDNVPAVDSTPSYIQAAVPKTADIRATVVGDSIFAASMVYEAGSPIDVRLNTDVQIQTHDLPPSMGTKLTKLVKKLGLRFASCDLALDNSGRYFFLESNVSGNWLWTEHAAAIPISRAIATLLMTEGQAID